MKAKLQLIACLLFISQLHAQTVELVYSGLARSLSAAGNKVYFSSYDTVDFKDRPYVTSGTPATSIKLNNCICQNYQGSASFIATSQDVYFTCDDSTHGAELWATNGTPSSTRLVKDLTPGTGSNLSWLTYTTGAPLGNKLIFGANTGTDYELWSSDGSTNGTNVLIDLVTGSGMYYSSAPSVFYTLGDKVFFFAGKQAFSSQRYLYLTDGTSGATNRMNDLAFNEPIGLNGLVRNNTLLFSTTDNMNLTTFYLAYPIYDPMNPYKYFTSIGTGLANNGVQLMSDTSIIFTSFKVNIGKLLLRQDKSFQITDTLAINNTSLAVFASTGKKTYFTQYTPNYEGELWVTDGTKTGTSKLITLNQGGICQNATSNAEPIVYKDKVYFINCDSIHGKEIWVSDGTVAGTHYLCEGAIGDASTQCDQMVIAGNYIYFNGMDANYTPKLWRIQIDTGNNNTSTTDFTSVINDKLMIYPNPAAEFVYLNNHQTVQVSILTLEGREVVHQTLEVGESMNVKDLNIGIYLVKINNQQFQKLVVMKQ